MNRILTVTVNPTIDISSEADVVRPIHKTRTSGLHYEPGGGGINVARVITELGGDSEALFLAGGEIGSFLKRLLQEEGIRGQAIAISGQTRIALMVREQTTGLEYRFVPDGPIVSAEEIQPCIDAVSSHPAGYVVVSGSLPRGAPADVYARLAEAAAGRGARLVLDSSGPGLRETLARTRVFLVKPSRSELETLAGKSLDDEGIRDAATEIVARGAAELVAVTLGADGALLASSTGIISLPAVHVRVRSAVGAGDSFLGAMTWALSEGIAPEDAFRLGMAAGAAAVQMPGSKLCQRDDVFQLYSRIGGSPFAPQS